LSEWREVELGSLLGDLIDYRGKTPAKASSGIKLITAKVIKGGRIDKSRLEYISEATYSTWMRRGFPQRGDILVTTEAPLGEVAQLRSDERVALAQRVILLRPDAARVHPQFLFHFLRSPQALDRLRERSSGTTVSGIRQPELRAVRIPLPDSRHQAASAAVLDAFDEMIEINERRIELQEDLARSLYREWFERFRFPGHEHVDLVDSELGPVPEGWDVLPLFAAADVAFGYSFKSPRFAESGQFPIVRIRDVASGSTRTFTDETAPMRYEIRDGDILIGMDGNFHLREWAGGLAWQNQRVARLRPLADIASRFLMLSVARPLREWNSAIVGTTVAHLGKSHLEEIRILVPPNPLREMVRKHFEGFGRRIVALQKQSAALASTRDLLLPRLVTGRLDISHIDLGALLPAEVA
jgi:type I restriction enzyme S subunit